MNQPDPTPEERAARVRNTLSREAQHFFPLIGVSIAIREALEEAEKVADERAEDARQTAFEEAAKLCEEWAGNYPPSIFPAHGESSDAKFGTFARHTSNVLAEAIRALAKEPS